MPGHDTAAYSAPPHNSQPELAAACPGTAGPPAVGRGAQTKPPSPAVPYGSGASTGSSPALTDATAVVFESIYATDPPPRGTHHVPIGQALTSQHSKTP